VKKIVVTDPQVIGLDKSLDDLIDDDSPLSLDSLTEEQVIEYSAGLKAGTEGQPNDDARSNIWQRGWADAQE
jgi:hypothetical protein